MKIRNAMQIRPRYMPASFQKQDESFKSVVFEFGYRDRQFATKNTKAEPILTWQCFDENSVPLVIKVLGFRARAIYSVPVELHRLQGKEDILRNSVNTFLHDLYSHQAFKMQLRDSIYCTKVEFEKTEGGRCLVDLFVLRSEDVRHYRTEEAIKLFVQSELNMSIDRAELVNAETHFGRRTFTDQCMADDFCKQMHVEYCSRYDVDASFGSMLETQTEEGMRVLFINVEQLSLIEINADERLSFFDNPNRGAFSTKIFGCVEMQYTPEEMRDRDRQQMALSRERYERHFRELSRRIRWNLDHQIHPAHDNLHRADPENRLQTDREFAFTFPPFNDIGRPDPRGIPDNMDGVETNRHALT